MAIIYGLVHADTMELRYIGQTKRPAGRAAVHLRQHPDLRMVILEREPASAREAERRWIRGMRALGANLLNILGGGAGCEKRKSPGPHSAEHRANLSASLTGQSYGRGHLVSPRTRAKISAALRGRARLAPWNKGTPLTAEHRGNISDGVRRHYQIKVQCS